MVDVWKIGVAISLANGVSPVLAMIAKDMLGLHGSVQDVEQGFKSWAPAILGAAAMLAGAGIIDGVAKLVEHGTELIHVQQQLATAGANQVEVAQATSKAWAEASTYGLKVADVLGDIKEARMVFGSTANAMAFIDPLEKMRVVLNSVTEGSGDKDAAYMMARAGELKGLQTPEQYVSYFDGMTKAISASGGKVDPTAFMQATQYGRISSKGWDESFYTTILPSLIQEMGASQAGGALMSLDGVIGQGKITKRSLQMLDQLGLVTDPSKVIYNKLGDPTGMQPGAIANTDEFMKNPYQWAQTTLHDALVKQFGQFQPGDPRVLQFLGGAFGNIRSAQSIATLSMEGTRINKDAGLVNGAQGLDAAQSLLQHDPTAVMNNFRNSWDNLLTALGAPLVQDGLNVLNAMSDSMKWVTAIAAANPAAVKLIGEALVGLGIALVGLGAAAIITAAAALIPGGAIAAAVAGIGTIIAAMAAFNFQAVTDGLTKFWNGIMNFVHSIPGIGALLDAAGPTKDAQGNTVVRTGRGSYTVPAAGSTTGGASVHPSAFIPPPAGGSTVMQPINVSVDGRTLAQVMTKYQTRGASGPDVGSAYFDPTRTVSSVA